MTNHTDTYLSLAALADTAGKHVEEAFSSEYDWTREYRGVSSWKQAYGLAVNGWHGVESEVLEIVDSAIESVESQQEMDSFTPVWDTAGSEVDVARYLAGEPENMIDYHITPATRVGRVVTLCASVSVSGAVSNDAIKKRGYGIAALAFALSKLGFAVELWADLSAKSGSTTGRIRVLVKGANDELDPAKIMFAYAHPALLRTLCFSAMHAFPSGVRKALDVGGSYGTPENPKEDLPDGTIYLPSVLRDRNIPNAEEMLREQLTALGVIGE